MHVVQLVLSSTAIAGRRQMNTLVGYNSSDVQYVIYTFLADFLSGLADGPRSRSTA